MLPPLFFYQLLLLGLLWLVIIWHYAWPSGDVRGRQRPANASHGRPSGPGGRWTRRKRLLAIDVGQRPLAMAQYVGHQIAMLFAPACLPLFLSDGFKDALPAILGHGGFWLQPECCQGKGPLPKPRWMPLPGLLYAQVLKTGRRRRLVRVSYRVVFGPLDAVEQI